MIAQNKKVAILVSNYFEQAEFTGPLEALKGMGAQVEVISAVNEPLQGLNHVDKGESFIADRHLDEVDPNDYDALVLPGGAINADHLRMNTKAQEWVRSFLQSGKLVAAICHAPWLLVSAGVVADRTLTSFETIQDDIRNAGGTWVDKAIVTDKNLITSRKPDDVPAFNEAIIAFLGKPHAAF
jgi:protease I